MPKSLGGTRLASARLALQKKTKVNKNSKVTKIVIDDADVEYRCTCCGKFFPKQMGNFFSSRSPLYIGNNGYLSICKTCIEKYYVQLVEFYSGNEEKAIERCCQIFDWYFSDEVSAMTMGTLSTGKTRIGLYPSKMNLTHIKNKGETYLDTVKQKCSGNIDSLADIRALEESEREKNANNNDEREEDIYIPTKKDFFFWGSGYTPEEYYYLNEQYDEWTHRHEAETKAQEELFKNICIAQLTIQQVKQNGSSREVGDAMKAFQDLLGSANVKPNQNSSSMVDQNTFGTLIKKWEEEEPIPEPSEEFKDVDNIKKYIDTFFLGHLAKIMGIENDYSEQYMEEMSKYTVAKPEYREEEDDDGNSGEE